MVLYSTGMRNAELRHLQVGDIDSRRMLIHIQHGKGGRDRYVPLSARLLETLRVYYRWMRPKTWLFPGTIQNWRADKPITAKVAWAACRRAATRAQLKKRVSPHLSKLSNIGRLLREGQPSRRRVSDSRGRAAIGIRVVSDLVGSRPIFCLCCVRHISRWDGAFFAPAIRLFARTSVSLGVMCVRSLE